MAKSNEPHRYDVKIVCQNVKKPFLIITFAFHKLYTNGRDAGIRNKSD